MNTIQLLSLLVILISCTPTNIDNPPIEIPVKDHSSVEIPEQKTPEIKKLHWDHMPVTYKFEDRTCKLYQAGKFRRAVKDFENATKGAVWFEETADNPDIAIYCTLIEDCYKLEVNIDPNKNTYVKKESICAHPLAQATINKTNGSVIKHGTIKFFGFAGFAESGRTNEQSGFSIGSCGHTTVEIHEILHVFGYSHVDNVKSIMYPTELNTVLYRLRKPGDCKDTKRKIDNEIIDDLLRLYHIK